MNAVNKKNNCTIVETLSMLLLSTIKLIWFYTYIVKPENLLSAMGRSIAVLVLIYTLSNVFLFRKMPAGRLVIHELVSLIILADTMYYSYFNVLPSSQDAHFIRILPDIGRSLASVFKPLYLLLFADTLLYIKINKRVEKGIIYRRVRFGALVLSLTAAIVLCFDLGNVQSMDSMGYFNRFGLFHYHISQLLREPDNTQVGAEKNVSLELLTKYSTPPDTERKYHGIAKGRNLIVIQVEALQNFVINRSYEGQELTPNLNRLIKDNSLYYDRYYQQIGKGGTSDSEFTTLNSLLPSMTEVSYEEYTKNELYGLPHVLKDKGYSTAAYHGYKPDFWNRDNMYPVEGFDRFVSQKDFDQSEIVGMGVSDSSFFKQVSQMLKKEKQPYFAFMITLSSHHPYGLPKGLGKIKLKEEHENTMFGRYLNAINYTDNALGEFIDELKAEGLYDNSVIAIYGDHHALNAMDKDINEDMTEYLGHKYEFDEMFNVPLIINIPGSKLSEVSHKAGGHLDFMPTMLNLLGIENTEGNMLGQDLNNAEKGFAALKFALADGSYVDDEKIYLLYQGKKFEQGKAWVTKTRQAVDVNTCKEGYEKALKEIGESEYILKNNLAKKQPEKVESSMEQEPPRKSRTPEVLSMNLVRIMSSVMR